MKKISNIKYLFAAFVTMLGANAAFLSPTTYAKDKEEGHILSINNIDFGAVEKSKVDEVKKNIIGRIQGSDAEITETPTIDDPIFLIECKSLPVTIKKNSEVDTGCSVSIDSKNIVTGEHSATLTVKYVDSKKGNQTKAEVKISITKATMSPTITFPKDKTYDGEPVVTEVEGNPTENTPVVEYSAFGDEEWTDDAPSNAGEYNVRVHIDGDDEYSDYDESSTFTIAQATMSPAITFPKDKTYDGEPVVTEVEGNPTENTPVIEYLAPGAKTWTKDAPSNVGEYDVKVSIEGNDNYKRFESEVKTFEITPAEVTLDINMYSAKYQFDGTPKSLSGFEITGVSNKLYNLDDLDVTKAEKKSVSGTKVGKYEFKLSAEDFENTNKNFNVSYNITPGVLEIVEAAPIEEKASPLAPDTGLQSIASRSEVATSTDSMMVVAAIALVSIVTLGLYGTIRSKKN